MATKSSKKHIHSFSTNFFGAVGYISSSLVWLLALGCGYLLLPVIDDGTTYSYATDSSATALSPVLKVLLGALLVIVFWAFWFVASKLLSRIIRRFLSLFVKKVTSDILFKAKYFIHAIGLVLFVVLLLLAPLYVWEKSAFALVGFIAGVAGVAALSIQQVLAKRHRVPADRVL